MFIFTLLQYMDCLTHKTSQEQAQFTEVPWCSAFLLSACR